MGNNKNTRDLKLIKFKSKKDKVKEFIEEVKKYVEENDIENCICMVIHKDSSSELFFTRMDYSNLIGFLEAQKQIFLDEWLG